MLTSLNYWSLPGGLEGTLTPEQLIDAAARHGYEAVELAIGDSGSAFGLDATEARCAEVRQYAEARGVRTPSVASGLYWSRALGDADPGSRARARADLEAMIQITRWLGADTLLTIPGAVDVFFLPDRPRQPYAEVWAHATDGLRSVLPTAEAHRVRLGIENVWNKFLTSPLEMATFIDQFASPWVGAYVDVANIVPYGFAQDWLRALGHRVVGVHFKDFRRAVGNLDGFVDLLEGDVDWPEVTAALAEIGYSGPVVAELIPCYRFFPEVRVANTRRAMDAILGRTD